MDARKNIILDVPASRTCVPLAACQPVPSGVTESLRIMPRVRPLAAEPPRFENRCYPLRRSGFTLVEMLTVIVIISILAGLITAAAVPAIRRAREATIVTEISQLGLALEKYKQERGDYPPDFAGVMGGAAPADNTAPNSLGENARKAVLQHFRKAFPRYTPGANNYKPAGANTAYEYLLADISFATRSDPNQENTGIAWTAIDLNPATALVLMLGGPPAPESSSTKLRGFSANPANPFAIGGSRLPTLYEFDEKRLNISYTSGVPDNMPTFIPPHVQQVGTSKAPYVYFRPRNRDYGQACATGAYPYELPFFCQSLEQGICTPYAEKPSFENNKLNRWVEPTKYQIICSGLDGLFGKPITDYSALPVQDDSVGYSSSNYANVRFLSGDDANIDSKEDDNITNFTQGKLADRAED